MPVNFRTAFIFFSLLLLCLVSCGPDDTVLAPLAEIDHTLLRNEWMHSYEEETDDTKEIYRPRGYKEFPTSRFRAEFKLYGQDSCRFLELAPNDAHISSEGSWSYEAPLLTISRKSGNHFLQKKILELSIGKLVLEKE